MPAAPHPIERHGKTAIIRVRGDVVISTARALHGTLRGLQRRRDVKKVVVDFIEVGKLDSSGVAVLEVARRNLKRCGKDLALDHLDDRHEAALKLAPKDTTKRQARGPDVGFFERVGAHVLATASTIRDLASLVGQTLSQAM